jgi:hypothetical protein
VNANVHRQLDRRERRTLRRIENQPGVERHQPMMAASNIPHEIADRTILGDEAVEIRHLVPPRAVREEASRLAPPGDASGAPDAQGASSRQPELRSRSDRV